MGKPTGFLDYARMDCPARSAGARVADWAPLDLPLSEKNRRRQSGRCMDCGVPFCQAGVTFAPPAARCTTSSRSGTTCSGTEIMRARCSVC